MKKASSAQPLFQTSKFVLTALDAGGLGGKTT